MVRAMYVCCCALFYDRDVRGVDYRIIVLLHHNHQYHYHCREPKREKDVWQLFSFWNIIFSILPALLCTLILPIYIVIHTALYRITTYVCSYCSSNNQSWLVTTVLVVVSSYYSATTSLLLSLSTLQTNSGSSSISNVYFQQ